MILALVEAEKNTKNVVAAMYKINPSWTRVCDGFFFMPSLINNCVTAIKEYSREKTGFIFGKALDIISLMWYCVVLPEVIKMNVIKELWHGNIIPQEDSRTNSKEMKELLGYMARHHEDLEKTFTEEQKEIFDKFHDCWSEYMSLAEAAIFEYAFKLGVQIAIETLHK